MYLLQYPSVRVSEFIVVVLSEQALFAPAICISSSLFMKLKCTCLDPGSAREVCHLVIHAWSRPAEITDMQTTGWICSVGIDSNFESVCRLWHRSSLVHKNDTHFSNVCKSNWNQKWEFCFHGWKHFFWPWASAASLASCWLLAGCFCWCALPVAVDDKEK